MNVEIEEFEYDPTLPLAAPERPNLKPDFPQNRRSNEAPAWGTPEARQAAIEGRKTATPKKTYQDAISAHCRACWIYQEDCAAGEGCNLYTVRTPRGRRKHTKTAIKRAIRAECQACLGVTTDRDACLSPGCGLYPVRFGRTDTTILIH